LRRRSLGGAASGAQAARALVSAIDGNDAL
jgi:hypothetical protein